MTRQLFWVAAALTLSMSLFAHDHRALAQQAEEASAEAAADTSQADADASADASATESGGQADAQATTSEDASTEQDSSTQSGSQSNATEGSTTSESQPATSNDAADNQSAEGTSPAVPPPSNDPNAANDPNATQPREQSRVTEGQRRDQQDATTNRDQQRGRTEDGRSGRDRESDLRVGIQFGRATDRGLTINQIEQNSFYHRSGFRRGDVIVSVHGRPIRSDADFIRFIIVNPGQRVPVVVLRDGRRETIYVQYRDVAQTRNIPGDRQYQAGGAYLGVGFDAQVRDAAVVLSVNPGSPAQEAGLQPGDILIALNGQEVRSYPDAIAIIRSMRPGDQLEIVVERARVERQVVAMLDTPPSVRTAARPELQVERQTGEQPAQLEIQIDERDENGRLLDRNRSGRGILPRRGN